MFQQKNGSIYINGKLKKNRLKKIKKFYRGTERLLILKSKT